MKRSAQSLKHRVAFDAPLRGDDGHGGVTIGWASPENAVVVQAHFRFLRGGEAVQAARLTGRQPVVVTVRASSQVAAIDASWRMRDARSGDIFNVRSGPIPSDDRRWLEFTVESGVAT